MTALTTQERLLELAEKVLRFFRRTRFCDHCGLQSAEAISIDCRCDFAAAALRARAGVSA